MAEEISRKSVIYDILFDFKRGNLSADQAEKKLKGIDRAVGSLSDTFKQLAGVIAGALTLQKLAQFTQEAIKLAAAAEGVRTAFNRLNNPSLLSELRKATRNTITDLELMKAAVRAENFKIPLEKLAGFFQFAQQRARATGESVEFLVDSIVTGIGRKSTLVLDNLGISAVELQEEIKKVGDFGIAAANIIEREMKKAGDSTETAADKLAQFSTALENLKLIFGEILLPPFTEALGDLSSVMQKLGDDTESTSKKIANLISYFLTGDNPISAWFKDITGISTVTSKIEDTQRVINELKDSADRLGVSSRGLITPWGTLTEKGEEFVLQNNIVIKGLNDTEEATNKTAKGFINLSGVISQLSSTVDSTINEKLVRNIIFINQAIEFYEKKIQETGTATVESRRQTTIYTEKIRELKEEIELILKPIEDLSRVSLESANAQVIAQKSIQDVLDESIKKYQKLADTIKVSVEETDPSKAGSGLMNKRIEQIKSYLTASQELNTSLHSLQESITNNQASYQKDADALAQALQNKLITQEQYNQGVEQLNRDKARADLAFTLAEIAINSGLAIASIVKSASQTAINPIQAIVEIVAGIAAVLAGISQAYNAVSAAGYEEGTEYLKRGKNKSGKDTIPVMANEGEAIIPTDKNMSEPGLAKAWIDGSLDQYIYRNYVMPEMLRATGKGRNEKDYSSRFYKQFLATQEQTHKQVSLLRSIDSKLNGGADYRSRYGRA